MKTCTFPMEITKVGARSLQMNMGNAELYLKEAIKQLLDEVEHDIMNYQN